MALNLSCALWVATGSPLSSGVREHDMCHPFLGWDDHAVACRIRPAALEIDIRTLIPANSDGSIMRITANPRRARRGASIDFLSFARQEGDRLCRVGSPLTSTVNLAGISSTLDLVRECFSTSLSSAPVRVCVGHLSNRVLKFPPRDVVRVEIRRVHRPSFKICNHLRKQAE